MTTPAAPPHAILIVEDDDDSRTLLKHLLTLHGYEVQPARNGLEGLRAARACRPALILLDLHMPVMDGFTFRQHQLADPALAGIPVVCVSAVDGASRQAHELGAVPLIGKPIDFDRLLMFVTAAIGRGAPVAELRAG